MSDDTRDKIVDLVQKGWTVLIEPYAPLNYNLIRVVLSHASAPAMFGGAGPTIDEAIVTAQEQMLNFVVPSNEVLT